MDDTVIFIYGRSGCPYTESAREYLIKNNIPYIYFEVPKVPYNDMGPFRQLAKENNHSTVPCLFSVKYIGGFDDISKS
jgi:glutaredoxin